MRAAKKTQGFTLVEIMMVVAIMGFVAIGTYTFFTANYRALYKSENQLLINKDMRTLTDEMSDTASSASKFYIYSSIADADHGTATDELESGQSGDFLVLVYFGQAATPTSNRPIERIVGYYRAPSDPSNPNSSGPVRKFDSDTDNWGESLPSTSGDIESLLPTEAQMSGFHVIVQLARGLANRRLFYDFRGTAIMIKGEINRNSALDTITNTYNFTISPTS